MNLGNNKIKVKKIEMIEEKLALPLQRYEG